METGLLWGVGVGFMLYRKKPEHLPVFSAHSLYIGINGTFPQTLLGGPRDLVTTDNWDYNPTYTWGNP